MEEVGQGHHESNTKFQVTFLRISCRQTRKTQLEKSRVQKI